jgi:hypothetical protein
MKIILNSGELYSKILSAHSLPLTSLSLYISIHDFDRHTRILIYMISTLNDILFK